jgi:quinol monooxygenase YgiN
MTGTVFYVFELAIREGQLDNFRAVMNEMVEATLTDEPHTLGYEWFISPDGTVCHTCERYENSAAVITHMMNVRERFSQRLFSAAEPGRLVVCGDPDEEVRAMFASLNPVYLKTAAGFTR